MLATLLRKTKHHLFFSYLTTKRKFRELIHKPVIHVFGDSHSQLFQHELFIIHHIGPATAYKLAADKSTTKAKEKIYSIINQLPNKRNNILLFVFGEIDCRIHIYKVSKVSNISLEKAIENTATAYSTFLNQVKKKFPNNNILVLNVLPAGEEKNIYQVKYYPSRKLHMEIVKKFNKTLSIVCKENDFIYLSVFDTLIDKKGNRISKYIFDDIHYKKNIIPFVIKELHDKHIV